MKNVQCILLFFFILCLAVLPVAVQAVPALANPVHAAEDEANGGICFYRGLPDGVLVEGPKNWRLAEEWRQGENTGSPCMMFHKAGAAFNDGSPGIFVQILPKTVETGAAEAQVQYSLDIAMELTAPDALKKPTAQKLGAITGGKDASMHWQVYVFDNLPAAYGYQAVAFYEAKDSLVLAVLGVTTPKERTDNIQALEEMVRSMQAINVEFTKEEDVTGKK